MASFKSLEEHECDLRDLLSLRDKKPIPSHDLRSHMTRAGSGTRRFSSCRLRDLRSIIRLDLDEKTVTAEAGVTMEDLVQATLAHGLVPQVVPEFRGITVGGAVVGAALESSSFRCGQLSDCCTELELVLPHGEVIGTSAEQHPELFYGVSGSYGSIAKVAMAKIRLESALPFVLIEYHKVSSYHDVVTKFQELSTSDDPPDFMDAIVIKKDLTLLMTGRYVQEAGDLPLLKLNHCWSPWFCQIAVDEAKKSEAVTRQVMRTEDYLFRYDRGAFWMGQFMTSFSSMWRYLASWTYKSPSLTYRLRRIYRESPPSLAPGPLFRFCFGWLLDSTSMYRVLHKLAEPTFSETYFVQDFYVPTENALEFLDFTNEHLDIYPLWLGPMKGTTTEQFLSPHYLSSKARQVGPDFINIGIYGIPKGHESVADLTRTMEAKATELGARKMLYAQSYYSREEFWKVYDKARLKELRQEFQVEGILPDFYDALHSSG